jgi:glycosyltransferase 2 family protein
LVPLIVLPAWTWRISILSAALLLLIIVGLTVPAVTRRTILRFFAWLGQSLPGVRKRRVLEAVDSSLDGLSVLLNRRAALQIWGWSAISWSLGVFINLVVLRAAGLPLGLVTGLAVLVILQIGTKLPSLLAGVGVFEYLCIFSLSLFEINAGQALAFGVLLHAVVTIPSSLIGAVSLWYEKGDMVSLQPDYLHAAVVLNSIEPDKAS